MLLKMLSFGSRLCRDKEISMALSIDHPDADKLARELARRQKKSVTQAVMDALEAELKRERQRRRGEDLIARVRKITEEFAALPVLDDRSPDEILGYDENGLPT